MLQDEIATKEAIIKTLDSSPSNKQAPVDLETLQNLRNANERLMQQMIEMQRGLNNSQSNINSQGSRLQKQISGFNDTQYDKLDLI